MTIEFTASGESPRYGKIEAGTVRSDIDPADEKAFVKRGIAKQPKTEKKEVKKDVRE